MITTLTPAVAQEAAEYLSRVDPTLAPVIANAGLCTIQPHQDYYRSLVDSIIGQQLSVKAAASIKRRFRELWDGRFPEPAEITAADPELLRTAGLSYAKTKYIQDLAAHVLDGRVRFDRIDKQTDEEIIQKLTAVKGIGDWTVHMFLMFCVGRVDVLPIGDLGVRNGIGKLYGLSQPPKPLEVVAFAQEKSWHPYATVASWYIWESYDTEPFIP